MDEIKTCARQLRRVSITFDVIDPLKVERGGPLPRRCEGYRIGIEADHLARRTHALCQQVGDPTRAAT